jgi:hypothetical protein
MMVTALTLMIAAATMLAVLNWRAGFTACILVGFVQEPLRKLAPGAPIWFQIIVGFPFAAMVLGILLTGGRMRMRSLHFGDVRLATAWQAFVAVVVLQALHTLVRYSNPVLPVLGLIFYFTPILAMIAATFFVRTERDIEGVLRFYLFLAVPAALSVYLSYFYGDSILLLREVGAFSGSKMMIYQFGTGFYSHSGIMRVGETAAWHAAAAVAFLVILGLISGKPGIRIVVGLLVTVLVGAIMLTGRRKMLASLAVFVATYWMLLAWLGQVAHRRIASTALTVAVIGFLLLGFEFGDGGTDELYVKRGATVFEYAPDRAVMAVHLLYAALWSQGPLGAGAGVSAHGSQFFGGGWQIYGADESGLGKIAGELGIPGLVVIAFLLYRLAHYVRNLLLYVSRVDRNLTVISCGLVSFAVGNAFAFIAATQLFGDPFVLLMLGWSMGFVLAIPKLVAYRQALRNRPQPVIGDGSHVPAV